MTSKSEKTELVRGAIDADGHLLEPLRHIIEFVGADKFFWASDFPHPDHGAGYMEDLAELVAPLSQKARRGILWENVSKTYNLGF